MFIFPCSAGHVQDWQLYPVDPYSCYMCDHTYTTTSKQRNCVEYYCILCSTIVPCIVSGDTSCTFDLFVSGDGLIGGGPMKSTPRLRRGRRDSFFKFFFLVLVLLYTPE